MLRVSVAVVATAFAVAMTTPVPAAAQSRPITIHADQMLDGRGASSDNPTITVFNGRIISVGGAGRGGRGGFGGRGRFGGTPDTTATYDLTGLTLLPGLIDAHAHIAWVFNDQGRLHTGADGESAAEVMTEMQENALATLLGGVTTIQSPGDPRDQPLRDAIARGSVPGPRILTSLAPFSNPALTTDSMLALIRTHKAQDADFIKIFASGSIRDGGQQTMSDAQLQALCGAAKAVGLRTLVHAHSSPSVEAAINAGCTQIEHGLFATDADLKLMADKGIYFDPQCSLVFRNYLQNRPKYQGIGNYTADGFAAMQKELPAAVDLMKRALATPNLKVVFGTDAVAGSHGRNMDELLCRIRQAGQDPMAAIVSATSLAAQAMGMGESIGALAPGFQADIIGVRGDPSVDPTALQRVEFVMKGGTVYRNLLRAAPPDSAAVIAHWLGMTGPDVAVSYNFAKGGTVAMIAEPGDSASTAHYTFDGHGKLSITLANGTVNAYRYLIDGPLLTLDQDNGPRFIFRRAP